MFLYFIIFDHLVLKVYLYFIIFSLSYLNLRKRHFLSLLITFFLHRKIFILKMVYKCAAINCKSGYSSEEKKLNITYHSFPLKNEELLCNWLKNIARKNF